MTFRDRNEVVRRACRNGGRKLQDGGLLWMKGCSSLWSNCRGRLIYLGATGVRCSNGLRWSHG